MYPIAYIDFLTHFHGDRDYFECHEILEEYWKKSEIRDKESIWVGFIMLAVANYHHRRGNFAGALRTLRKSKDIFIKEKAQVERMGLGVEELLGLIDSHLIDLEFKNPYNSYNLPITDSELVSKCKLACKKNGYTWCTPSDLTNIHIIHRHSARDRTEVIEERKAELVKRRNRRN